MSNQVAQRGAFEGDAPQILRLGPDRVSIAGTMAQVNRVVGDLRQRGQLAKCSDPQPNGTGGVLVTVRVLPREVALPAPEPQRKMRWSRNWVLGVAGGVATVLALCGLAVRAAFLWAAAHAAGIGTAILGVVVLIAALTVANAVTGGRIVEVFVRVKVK